MTTEYAVRALLYLCSGDVNSPRRIGEVASGAQVPESYLRKIVPVLTKAGFVRSSVGVTGGIQLAVSATELTLLDVFEAVEGKMFLNKCLIHHNVCHRSPYCAVHVVWSGVQEQIKTSLRAKTLADLATETAANFASYMSMAAGAKAAPAPVSN
jgi:Rrf2 family protein